MAASVMWWEQPYHNYFVGWHAISTIVTVTASCFSSFFCCMLWLQISFEQLEDDGSVLHGQLFPSLFEECKNATVQLEIVRHDVNRGNLHSTTTRNLSGKGKHVNPCRKCQLRVWRCFVSWSDLVVKVLSRNINAKKHLYACHKFCFKG